MKRSKKKTARPQKKTFFDESNREKRKWLYYCAGVGATASLVTLAIMYFVINAGLTKAQRNLESCEDLLDKNAFFEAEQECEQAQEFLLTVRLVGQDKKEKLNRDVRELLASTKLQQGLLGNILVDGKYVSLPTKELIVAFKKAKTSGDIFFEQKSWFEAKINYQRALEVATKTSEIDQSLLAKAHKQLSRTQFNILVQNGEKSLVVSDWKDALVHFDQALQLAKKDPNISPDDMTQVTTLIHRAKFYNFRDHGNSFFEKNDWINALKNYEKALDLGHKIYPSDSNDLTVLIEDIARTKIYMTIEKGKKAFTDAHWNDAIMHYENAINLLTENSKILNKIKTKESSEKLSRILLQTTIIRDKQKVAQYIQSKQHEAALDKLRALQKNIGDSPAGDLPEFQIALQEISHQIDEISEHVLILNLTEYLMKNFEQLFLKHYPEATLSSLSSPKIEYLEKKGKNLLFRLQCTEGNRGRPIRLQIDYTYSPETDSWQIFNKQ